MRRYNRPVYRGRNRDQGAYRDTEQVRCQRCGYICNKDRDSLEKKDHSRRGWGMDYTSNTYTTTSDDMDHKHGVYEWGTAAYGNPEWGGTTTMTETRYNPTQTAGCPFCGTMLYEKKVNY